MRLIFYFRCLGSYGLSLSNLPLPILVVDLDLASNHDVAIDALRTLIRVRQDLWCPACRTTEFLSPPVKISWNVSQMMVVTMSNLSCTNCSILLFQIVKPSLSLGMIARMLGYRNPKGFKDSLSNAIASKLCWLGWWFLWPRPSTTPLSPFVDGRVIIGCSHYVQP